ncbi:DUF5343 domain-containing protein [Microcella daejeonensis]|uniref:DUF5343 domain-containing protein n=1 Tax=Microcella daejeonensis TaxID=2994971 RepID=A0A9E8MJC0_9MICO|nr:DUF5343 domain-containing protein [Microcella daejeonensis]WAB80607.1 DUF5343 domain-containing protein [Microcella daejeonensis]
MSQFPYTVAPGPLGEFLEKLKNIGVPDKIDYAYLGQIGFTSSNHRPFVPILKHIELLDGKGVPTDRYRKGLRGGESGKAIVAEGIRNGYSKLFSTYPDAATRPTTELTTFVKANSDLGDKALRSAVSTFQTVCKFGNFGAPAPEIAEEEHEKPKGNHKRVESGSGTSGAVTINVNLALSVDATSDPAVYDAFFAAMAKHLKVLDGGSANPA